MILRLARASRSFARRAGVSHAAPAHHFGDRRGVFTAIATEGFGLLHAATSRAASEPDALVQNAAIVASFAYQAANRVDPLPRKQASR